MYDAIEVDAGRLNGLQDGWRRLASLCSIGSISHSSIAPSIAHCAPDCAGRSINIRLSSLLTKHPRSLKRSNNANTRKYYSFININDRIIHCMIFAESQPIQMK